MEFPSKWKTRSGDEPAAEPTKANTFWEQAKAAHADFFNDFLAEAGDDYESWEDFSAELHRQSWDLIQELCKMSYSNAIRNSRKPRRRR